MKDPYTIIKNPLATEKAVRLMEAENKLIFIVDKKATRTEVKKAVEELFKVKVEKVNTLIDTKGRKKAYTKLSMETPAIDIATQMGII
ncbi:MAG: 50S ribosomal protein L23 [Nanoarchaeota archaeon]|nr:50S ribosomal protein L23 [Nanoarchaeota archaeon]MCG2718149.1 50S ribosomal protein L23 [Nanoarchaeota archaeon]